MFFYIVLTPISTTSGLWSTGNTRKHHQIDVYIYQFDIGSEIKTNWLSVRAAYRSIRFKKKFPEMINWN